MMFEAQNTGYKKMELETKHCGVPLEIWRLPSICFRSPQRGTGGVAYTQLQPPRSRLVLFRQQIASGPIIQKAKACVCAAVHVAMVHSELMLVTTGTCHVGLTTALGHGGQRA
jgi:hypothetical protein